MSKKGFDKFINKKPTGAKKKEIIKQEKRKVRAEKNAYFDEQKRLARERKEAGKSRYEERTSKKAEREERVRKPVEKENKFGDKKPERRVTTAKNGTDKFAKKDFRTTDTRGPKSKEVRKDGDRKPFKRADTSRTAEKAEKKFSPKREAVKEIKPAFKRTEKVEFKKTTISKATPDQKLRARKPLEKKGAPEKEATKTDDEMPLNKFIAWCGVCGRREAADLIKAGKVEVNGQVITNPPHRVSKADAIKVSGKKISVQKNLVYILLNKPKDYITTTDDPEGRKTVMDLVKNATDERVFPVGRLDRNTTGVLLLTNDGEVAQRLTHPKYEVRKIYEVKVDKVVTKQQLDTIANGLNLEDGFVQPDAVAYADAQDKSVVGIEIHSGRNRIVRRIFESLGFKVKNLDRVMYGIFTKKNVDRGKWRMLSEKEIRLLKHLNTSFASKKKTR